jgi:DNA-binding IclR family transcriptional regulator
MKPDHELPPDEMPLDARPRVEAVERSLLLLQCFREEGEALSLAVLAQRSDLYKSTILRLTASLIYMGFLRRDPNGHFSLGPELRRLGALSQARVNLEGLVRPVLQKLATITQETTSFYVRDGVQRICLYRVNSTRSARHHLDEGSRHPLNSGAAGSILRAYGKTSKDAAAAAIKARGWVFSNGERDPDLAAIAAPLLNKQGELLGALTVSGLISRFGPERLDAYRRELLDATQSLLPRLPPLNYTDLGDSN